MPILSPLGNLFGRSPIEPIQVHMSMVDRAAQLVPDLLRASAADDWEAATGLHQRIVDAQYGSIFLVMACLFGFFMAWGIGANDVANAMGTSVGSKGLADLDHAHPASRRRPGDSVFLCFQGSFWWLVPFGHLAPLPPLSRLGGTTTHSSPQYRQPEY